MNTHNTAISYTSITVPTQGFSHCRRSHEKSGLKSQSEFRGRQKRSEEKEPRQDAGMTASPLVRDRGSE
jgi:hypothetical protein